MKIEFERGDRVIIVLNDAHLEPKERLHKGYVTKKRSSFMHRWNKAWGYEVMSDSGSQIWKTAIPDYVVAYDENKWQVLQSIFETYQSHYEEIRDTKKLIRETMK